MPHPNQWTTKTCKEWLSNYSLSSLDEDYAFITNTITHCAEVAHLAKDKKKHEQSLLLAGGSNWTGIYPIL